MTREFGEFFFRSVTLGCFGVSSTDDRVIRKLVFKVSMFST